MYCPTYTYQAELWCPSCARSIRDELDAAGERPADPDDLYSYDSDGYPKPVSWCSIESDAPDHCGAGAECLEAEELSDGSRVGRLLTEYLTAEGLAYVREAALEAPASPVVALWLDAFPDAAPKYSLRFVAYCGMSHELESSQELEYARHDAASYLRRARADGLYVDTLDPGERWELRRDPPGALVGDDEGWLILSLEGR